MLINIILKMPNGQSEVVSRRRIGQYNGQKEKKSKGQTMISETLHRKPKIEEHEPH